MWNATPKKTLPSTPNQEAAKCCLEQARTSPMLKHVIHIVLGTCAPNFPQSPQHMSKDLYGWPKYGCDSGLKSCCLAQLQVLAPLLCWLPSRGIVCLPHARGKAHVARPPTHDFMMPRIVMSHAGPRCCSPGDFKIGLPAAARCSQARGSRWRHLGTLPQLRQNHWNYGKHACLGGTPARGSRGGASAHLLSSLGVLLNTVSLP